MYFFIKYCTGCHLVHSEIVNQVPEIKNYKVGMANIFCAYTPFTIKAVVN